MMDYSGPGQGVTTRCQDFTTRPPYIGPSGLSFLSDSYYIDITHTDLLSQPRSSEYPLSRTSQSSHT
ncbi:hypothetical protein E4T56_gene12682 [Termitomyces sp. T112]|nr:hypothetical protein E4T56_gene12682 [Termitomyces sp. T112]